MPLLMSQKEYAAHRGVGAPAVSNWKKANLLVFAPDPDRPGKQLVDVERSDLLVNGKVDQTRGRPPSAARAAVEAEGAPAGEAAPVYAAPPASRGMSQLEQARLDEMRERTRRRQIETAQLLGGLVSAAEAERQAGEMGRKVREGVHSLIRAQSERLAAETDPRRVVALLSEGVDTLFDRLAAEIAAEAAAERQADRELAPLEADEEDEDE